MKAGLLIGALLLATPPPALVAAQERGAAPQRPRPPATAPVTPQLRRMTDEPFSLGRPAPQAPRRADRLPVPDRGIEAPRDRFANDLQPSLEPMLLPPERRAGVTFGREHFRETGPDRPFDQLLPGARLRIPFEGSGGR
jgi:hypothetical protein